MTLSASTASVTATAASVIVTAEGNAMKPTSAIIKVPSGGTTIYIGNSAVDSSDGFPIAATEAVEVNVTEGEDVYAVADSGGQAVNLLIRS